MENLTEKDLEAALQALSSMISRTENVKTKFKEGSSQHSLQRNRLAALKIASFLISQELGESPGDLPTEEELQKARAPIASLLSKSEKAQQKLAPGTWQHTMLEANLRALAIAAQLLDRVLEGCCWS